MSTTTITSRHFADSVTTQRERLNDAYANNQLPEDVTQRRVQPLFRPGTTAMQRHIASHLTVPLAGLLLTAAGVTTGALVLNGAASLSQMTLGLVVLLIGVGAWPAVIVIERSYVGHTAVRPDETVAGILHRYQAAEARIAATRHRNQATAGAVSECITQMRPGFEELVIRLCDVSAAVGNSHAHAAHGEYVDLLEQERYDLLDTILDVVAEVSAAADTLTSGTKGEQDPHDATSDATLEGKPAFTGTASQRLDKARQQLAQVLGSI